MTNVIQLNTHRNAGDYKMVKTHTAFQSHMDKNEIKVIDRLILDALRSEPSLPTLCNAAKVCYLGRRKNVQQLLGF